MTRLPGSVPRHRDSSLPAVRWRCLVVGLVALMAATPAAAEPFGEGPWFFRAYDWSEETLAELGTHFEHFAVFPEKGLVLIQADDREELGLLRQAGLRLELDPGQTATLREIARARERGIETIDAIPGFACYRTVEETLATGAALAAAHPDLATWLDVGDSWEKINAPPAGFDLHALRLTNSAVAGDKPDLVVTSAIHAREYATAELVTRFAEHLVAEYGADPDVTWILDHHEIHLLLQANPDGRERAETGLSWRKNANNDFCTDTDTRGIDLNRNFDFEWSCCGGGSNSECALTYRGPSAGSEPETQAVQDYLVATFPDQRPDDLTTPAPLDAQGIYLDVHSFGQVVLSSWGFQSGGGNPPNAQGILTLARKYGFFPGYSARLGSLGIVDGSTKDFAYGRLGVPGYTVELGTAFFQQCSFFETAILPGNLAALVHAAKNVRTPYVTPSGPDTLEPAVPPLPVAAGALVELTATVDDTRYDGAEPTQTIAAAEVYVDQPPWQGGAAVAMAAVDGAFDETVEEVAVALDTTGLPPGRHTLFVRGQDAGTTFGAVSAEFLFVIDPASAPVLQGTVTDRLTGTAVGARVAVGPFEVTASAATGAYSLQLPSGTYDVAVTAPGYAPATLGGVTLADFQTLTRNFRLEPLETVFGDDVEAGNQGWTAAPPWAITDEAANSPTRSWTDSPGGNYGNNVSTSLTSPVFDLSRHQGTVLSFHHIYDFEEGFDSGVVEVSTDGVAWSAVRGFSLENQNAVWERVEIPLPALDGSPTARIRFRVESDANTTRDGWHLDDLLLEAASSGGIFSDGFESGDTSAWSGGAP